MPEYNLVKKAALSPTACRFCGDHVGPFIDTFVDDPVHGHVYICAPHENREGCVGQMAFKCGYITPKRAAELEEEIEQLKNSLNGFGNQQFTITPSQLFEITHGIGTATSSSGSSTSTLRWLGKEE